MCLCIFPLFVHACARSCRGCWHAALLHASLRPSCAWSLLQPCNQHTNAPAHSVCARSRKRECVRRYGCSCMHGCCAAHRKHACLHTCSPRRGRRRESASVWPRGDVAAHDLRIKVLHSPNAFAPSPLSKPFVESRSNTLKTLNLILCLARGLSLRRVEKIPGPVLGVVHRGVCARSHSLCRAPSPPALSRGCSANMCERARLHTTE